MATFWQDVRFGLRSLRHSPAFALIAILTLALGIGANTAMFSVLNGALLRALPFHDPARLVVLHETKRDGQVSVSYPNFLDWRKRAHAFTGLAAMHDLGFNLAGAARPERIDGLAVSSNFLSLFGVAPILGRDLLPAEERPGAAPVVLLGDRLWASHFDSSPAALGRTITLDGRIYTIVGVLPPAIRFPETADVIVPIGVFANNLMERGDRGDMAIAGRLAPGATLSSARAEMSAIAAQLTAEYPKENSGIGVAVESLRDSMLGDTRAAVMILFGAVLFVLLIACVNVANLFLVRGAARSREIAVRIAFGAGRARIVRQMLTESLVLAAIGGAAGLLLAVWAIAGLARILPADLLGSMNIQPDRAVFLFAAALVVFVAAAAGLAPALRATNPQLAETLKEGGRGATEAGARQRLHAALVIAETALALVLLCGAGLMLKSLYLLLRVDPGFRPDNVLTMEVDLSPARYPDDAARRPYWQRAVDSLRAIPGVTAAAAATVVPLTGNHSRGDITILGRPIPNLGDFPHPDIHIVSPEYCAALGIPLLRGRLFAETDREGAPPVVLINDTLARRYWRDADPVGRQILLGHPGPDAKLLTIAGVVGDTRLYGLASPPRLEIYLPYRQHPVGNMTFVLRAAGDPAAILSAARAAIAAVDPDQPAFAVAPMRQLMTDSMPLRRLTWFGLALFSALALLLAAIGIYGVVSYAVERRTREIGIRMAVGARPTAVLRMIVASGLRLAAAGALIGIAVALAATRLLSTLLYGIEPTDPLTYIATVALLLAVAVCASYLPARQAIKMDTMTALRRE